MNFFLQLLLILFVYILSDIHYSSVLEQLKSSLHDSDHLIIAQRQLNDLKQEIYELKQALILHAVNSTDQALRCQAQLLNQSNKTKTTELELKEIISVLE